VPRIIRGALLQATWTGDKESMIQKHEGYAHEAAAQGAQVAYFGVHCRERNSAGLRGLLQRGAISHDNEPCHPANLRAGKRLQHHLRPYSGRIADAYGKRGNLC
jgi:hypothetical protein